MDMTTLELLDPELKVRLRQRPRLSCKKCHSSFPSVLDLSEHDRVDHKRTGNEDNKLY